MVDIGFDPAYVAGAGKIPNLTEKSVHALVDTGAEESFIDNDLAVRLNLPVVDKQHVSGSAGRHEVNVYLAQIHVPSITFTIYGRFGGVDLAAGGQRHHALIGRTFLKSFVMTYNGRTGAVELTFPDPPATAPGAVASTP
jgi:predicted aspartyl protease